MALDVKDGNAVAKTIKTTLDGADHVPHHLVDNFPADPATQTTLAAVLAAISPTLSNFRSLTLDSTAQAVKASAGELWGYNIINLNAADIYVKFYNVAAASVNPASDVPIKTLFVPQLSTVFQDTKSRLDVFSTAIAVRAVTGSGDTNTTAPSTLPIIEIKYS